MRSSSFNPRRLALALTAVTLAAVTAALLTPAHQGHAAEPQTKVILNGKAVPVYFNDGDSFRVLAGEFKDAKARLAGFNTLESYGPVHVWGGWTAKELYVLAKMGTYNGRDGVWECETEGKTDTYGRILVWCPKLAEDQIRKGYAHVMTIDDQPGRPELVAAQKEAIAARRGIWAHGVPDYILTSLHSKEEDVDGKGTYNRLISTVDGHSVKWRHTDRYRECDRVCAHVHEVDGPTIDALLEPCKLDERIGPMLAGLSDSDARSVLYDFAKHRHINRKIPVDQREPLAAALSTWVEAGRFGAQQRREGSCMIHVPFQRRFGGGKAECLK
ncbi:MAG: thermonuclease family protein [Enhygromyxa sp.]